MTYFIVFLFQMRFDWNDSNFCSFIVDVAAANFLFHLIMAYRTNTQRVLRVLSTCTICRESADAITTTANCVFTKFLTLHFFQWPLSVAFAPYKILIYDKLVFILCLYVCLFTLFILLLSLLSLVFFIDLFLSHLWMCVYVYGVAAYFYFFKVILFGEIAYKSFT